MYPKGCKLDECGGCPDGRRVSAITDGLGSDVVVSNPEDDAEEAILLSCSSHKEAIELGNQVAEKGPRKFSGWRTPFGSTEPLNL